MRLLLIGGLLIVMVGCATSRLLPTRPKMESEAVTPEQLLDFDVLYRQNCSGCHGNVGVGGPAPSLHDPTYLALVDDATIRRVATNGVHGTPMPAFGQSAGGLLTEKQVDVLVSGIRRWANPNALNGLNPPPYSSQEHGDSARGGKAFATYCAACHGAAGTGGAKASSIVDGSFLALVSDQGLRTSIIVGRPELGFPNWHDDVPGKPMSAQDVSDVVAWLSAQRPKLPGQPYSPSLKAGQQQ
jgi:mono/diheme cytochrome c family protein